MSSLKVGALFAGYGGLELALAQVAAEHPGLEVELVWVTDVPGITRNQALKALGNGVVPNQCAAALRAYIHDEQENAA